MVSLVRPGVARRLGAGGTLFAACLALCAVAGCLVAGPARAGSARLPAPPSARQAAFTACESAIHDAALAARLPPGLLEAVASVESGRPDPRPSVFRAGFAPAAAPLLLRPWPWTVDAGGDGQFFASRAAAIAAARALRQAGVQAIDVGCLQIDLRDHPGAFRSLDAAFDPVENARYAAGFLNRLFARLHSWKAAVAAYHSQSPALGRPYRRLVEARWRADPRPGGAAPVARYADFAPRNRAYADFAPNR